MSRAPSAVFLCNGARPPSRTRRHTHAQRLEYRADAKDPRTVEIGLPPFVEQFLHVPARTLDLLEIAAYVFAGDRLTRRGARDSLEYHSWSRTFEYVVRVRDHAFWSRPDVGGAICEALRFMTGDREYNLTFQPGHVTDPAQLFDAAGVTAPVPQCPSVLLFSGGLDSLAGALDVLAQRDTHACLVSHESQHGTIRTQRGLIGALKDLFPNRVHPYAFRCRLANKRAPEETQRTRSFLYFTVAFGVARALGLSECAVYENGFTAFALPERQDLLNSRASRTTHPKTIRLMENVLSLVADRPFAIHAPYRWKTKADVMRVLLEHKATDLITSSVSCSATFQKAENGRQCGKCSQCIERRLAAYASGLGDIDASGTYAFDVLRETIDDGETRTLLVDYLRLARQFAMQNESWFAQEKLSELADLVDYVDGKDDTERTTRIWQLCHRHGKEVMAAVRIIRAEYDDPAQPRPPGTLLDVIASKEYLKDPVDRLVASLAGRLQKAMPLAFRSAQPTHENQVNDLIEAILKGDSESLEREFPVLRFGTAKTVPDHATRSCDLFIEAKFLRDGASASKTTNELAADTVKYGKHRKILFVLYDPARSVVDDAKFAEPFEKDGRCIVCFVR